jgi:hypothetical protein
MKKIDLGLICGVMLVLTGCPYNSKHQLGKPEGKNFDTAILGSWVACDPKTKADCGRITVCRFNEAEYYVEMGDMKEPAPGTEKSKTERYRVFRTDIGVPGLYDVQDVDTSSETNKNHIYVKLELPQPGKLAVSYMSDDVTKTDFKSPKKLAGYIKDNYQKPGFFEPVAIFDKE